MGLFAWFQSNRAERKRDQAALEIDIAAGVLERCPICHAVSDRQRDDRLTAAEAAAQAAFERGDPLVAIFDGDREDLLRRLRKVREPLPYNCICQDSG